MGLEVLGKILSAGFGDKVLMGIIIGLLPNSVTPYRCYEYICNNTKLGYWVADGDWQKYRRMAKEADAGSVTKDDIINGLRKYRPDILGIIINTEGGDAWLDAQVSMLREKLGLS